MTSRPISWLLASFVMLPGAALGQSGGTADFSALSGSWSGTGSIALSSGVTERLRCQATYEVAPSGNSFQQNLRCKSDSYDFNLRTSVIRSGDSIAGTWAETTRNVTGSIAGRVGGGRIQATVQGPAFSANLSLSTQGNTQNVSIRSQGTELSAVSIALRRT